MNDREKAIEIVRVQQVAQGDEPEGVVEDLLVLGTESGNVAAIVNNNTGAALTAQIDNTEEIDPTIRPDLSNSVPITEPDIATTDIATPVAIDVLANDSDPDNDTIEIVDTLSTDNGEVVINPNNTLTYTPNNGFTGEDFIFYAIEDSNGNVDNNIVTVRVAPNEIAIDESNANIQGTEQADNITGNSQGNTITGLGGNDLFIYNELGDTPDTITDFTPDIITNFNLEENTGFTSEEDRPEEDRIVLTNLLDSIEFSGNDPIAEDFVQFSANGSDTVLSIDSDGSGDLQPQPLLIVRDVSIEELTNFNNFEF